MRRDDDDDDDTEYDPSAFVAAPAPQPVPVRVPPPRSIATSLHVSSSAAVNGAQAIGSHTIPSSGSSASAGGGAFPFLHRLRIPHVAPLSSIALQPDGGGVLCVGNSEGSLFMFDFRHNNDGALSSNVTSTAAAGRGGGGRGGVAGAPQPPPTNPLAPTRTMAPFPSSHGRNHAIASLTFLSDGAHFIAGHEGDHVMAIDSYSGRQLDRTAVGSRGVLDTVRQVGHKASVMCVSSSSSAPGAFCTASLDGTVRLWDVRTMKRHSSYAAKHGQSATETLTETTPLYACAVVHPALVASAGADGVVQLWDTSTAFRPSKSAMTIPPIMMAPSSTHGGGAIGPVSIGALLRIDDMRLALRCSDGRIGFVDLRHCGSGGVVAFAHGGASFPYRGDATTMVLHGHPATGTETILLTTSERGGGGGCLAEVSLESAAMGSRLLRAEPLASGIPDRRRGTTTSSSSGGLPDNGGGASSCSGVASDPAHDQVFVFGGGDSSDVQVRSAATRQLECGQSPVEQWFARSGRSGPKREREEAQHNAGTGSRRGGGAESTIHDDELFLF